MPLAARPSTAPRARRALTLLVAAAAMSGLAACAGQQDAQTEEFSGDKGQVQDVIQKLSDRAERDEAAAICRELLGTELKAALGGNACAEKVGEAINASDYTSLNVASVTIDGSGTTAVAQIKPVEDLDARRSITLTRTSKTTPWTISALDPTGKTAPLGTTPTATTPAETTPASTPKS